MKYVFSLAVVALLALSGCITQQSEGTKTWKRTTKIGSTPAEIIGAVLGTGRSPGPIETQTSWTDSNMPKHWR